MIIDDSVSHLPTSLFIMEKIMRRLLQRKDEEFLRLWLLKLLQIFLLDKALHQSPMLDTLAPVLYCMWEWSWGGTKEKGEPMQQEISYLSGFTHGCFRIHSIRCTFNIRNFGISFFPQGLFLFITMWTPESSIHLRIQILRDIYTYI